MDNKILEDIIEWNISNWSYSLEYWQEKVDIKSKKLICLELGGRRGGLSLWLALNENSVICSDLNNPKEISEPMHKKYGLVTEKISYESISALDIPYENKFDIVAFKSILGGISRNDNLLKKKIIDEIHKSLKDGGSLLFAENLEASFFHKILRNLFINWAKEWNYLKYNEIQEIFSSI